MEIKQKIVGLHILQDVKLATERETGNSYPTQHLITSL